MEKKDLYKLWMQALLLVEKEEIVRIVLCRKTSRIQTKEYVNKEDKNKTTQHKNPTHYWGRNKSL